MSYWWYGPPFFGFSEGVSEELGTGVLRDMNTKTTQASATATPVRPVLPHERRLVVMRGVPGSGKSTAARKLVERFLAEHPHASAEVFSADDYFTRADGTYVYEPAKIGLAHADCFRRVLAALARGVDLIVVDNTNTTAVEVAPYMLAAAAAERIAAILTVHVVDPAGAAARCTHGVPADVVAQMHATMANEKLPPWWNNDIMLAKGV